VDEREREHLINKLEEYSGAPIPVPGAEALTVELTKPTLERDPRRPGAVTLRFELDHVPDYWADVFNREAGGPSWPPGFPIPTLEDDAIQVVGLPVGDVRPYIEALRDHLAYTNREAERQRPEIEDQQREARVAARRFDQEFDAAQRFLDKQFGR